MRFTWGAAYIFLWFYRTAFSVIGQTVILPLTIMSDTTGYQQYNADNLGILLDSTATELDIFMQVYANLITSVVAAGFNILSGGSAIANNIGFQTIAFAGLVYFFQGLDSRLRATMFVLAMTPSFTLWSSMTSKEAIVVGVSCVLLRYIVDIYRNKDRLGVHHLGAMVLLYIFKPHFLLAYAFVIGTSKLARYVREPATLALIGGALSLSSLYVFRRQVNSYALTISGWMHSEKGGSSRATRFIAEQYDVFARAPEGMLRSFIGPTMSEATESMLQMISYLESLGIAVLLMIIFLVRLPRMPVYSAVMSFVTLFWIMFVTYPFGVANAGTAIRYRTDYLVLVFLCVAVLSSRQLYVEWRKGPVWPAARRRAAALARREAAAARNP